MNKVIIKTEDLCKTYVSEGEGVHVIKNVNIEIYEGDFTVIMGSSGSGKSTLLYLLSGLETITSGEVDVLETSMKELKGKSLAEFRRNTIGFIFQAINLVPSLSLLENVILPGYLVDRNKHRVDKRAEELLELMEVLEQKNRMPSQVSGGQQQRAAIARALINNPSILFADEPTGALNSTSGENVLDQLTELNRKGQTIVMVTHDLKAAVRANRILFLRDGRIDGDLPLPKYNKAEKEYREKEVFSYLTEMGW